MYEFQGSRKTILAIYLFVPMVFSFGQTDAIDRDKEAITAVSKARAAAFNQKDAKGIAQYFTEDAVLMAPEKPALIGTKAVEAYYQSIFDTFDVKLESYYEEVEVSGDMAIGRGEAIVELTPIGETTSTTASSKYLNVLKRQPDGTWKTTHDIWNGNGVSQ